MAGHGPEASTPKGGPINLELVATASESGPFQPMWESPEDCQSAEHLLGALVDVVRCEHAFVSRLLR